MTEITELAARVLFNDSRTSELGRQRAHYLRERGWEWVRPCVWRDWLTGKDYQLKQAYHIEIGRGIVCVNLNNKA